MLSDLFVCETTEVGQLDGLFVTGGQSVQCLVDRLADHCAGEIVPGQRPVIRWRALDQHLLQALVGSAHAAAVERPLPNTRHQPRSPRIAGRGGQHDEIRLFYRRIVVLVVPAVRAGSRARGEEPAIQHPIPKERITPFGRKRTRAPTYLKQLNPVKQCLSRVKVGPDA